MSLFYVLKNMLNTEQVQHIAKLARLGLGKEEGEKFARQLSDILAYVEMLNEVNTDKVEATSQVTGLENVSRDDVAARFCEKEELLACTELPVDREQIRVKPVITN
jgi:aspartyl-tRNA(Asn)/glutamyl-tRNA(Gln) amidotransferase subunit C